MAKREKGTWEEIYSLNDQKLNAIRLYETNDSEPMIAVGCDNVLLLHGWSEQFSNCTMENDITEGSIVDVSVFVFDGKTVFIQMDDGPIVRYWYDRYDTTESVQEIMPANWIKTVMFDCSGTINEWFFSPDGMHGGAVTCMTDLMYCCYQHLMFEMLGLLP